MPKINIRKITGRKSVLDQGWYLVLVNEHGHASSTAISSAEAKNCIIAIGQRGYHEQFHRP